MQKRMKKAKQKSAPRGSGTGRLPIILAAALLIFIFAYALQYVSASKAAGQAVSSLGESQLFSLLSSFSANTSISSQGLYIYKNEICNLSSVIKLYDERAFYIANGSVNASVTHVAPFTVSFKLAVLNASESKNFTETLNSTDGLCTPFLRRVAGNSTYSQSGANFSGVRGYANMFSNFTTAGWSLISPPNSPRLNAIRYTSFVVYKGTAMSIVMWAFNDTPGAPRLLINYTSQLVDAVRGAYASPQTLGRLSPR